MMSPLKQKLYEEVIKQDNLEFKDGTIYLVQGNRIQATLANSKEISITFKSRLLLLEFIGKIKKDPLGAWEEFRKGKPLEIAYYWEGRSI